MDTTLNNLDIYNRYAEVPKEAQKRITGGRLNGMTDVSPMWRIRSLTELFGPCGIGWYTEILDKRLEPGTDGELAAFVDMALYVKVGSEWSRPIVGTGGSMFVVKERNGLRTSDEAIKMASTDALSVCCKMLGIGANVYWAEGRTKYSSVGQTTPDGQDPKPEIRCAMCGATVTGYKLRGEVWTPERHAEMSRKAYGGKVYCLDCCKVVKAKMAREAEEAAKKNNGTAAG